MTRMPRPKTRRTVTRFRVVLMLALLAAVGVVVALYLFGAAGAPRPRRARSDTPPFEEGTRLVGKDFDYTFSQGDKAVFRVRGDSVRVDKDDTVYLQTVGLTLFDKEGRQFDAESDAASINRTTNEGRLWGDVSIKGPSHLEIYSKELLIQEKGNLLITPGVARILYAGKYFARCDTLQAWLPDEVYSMIGNMRLETFPEVQPPLRLEADKAIYERKQRLLRVEDGAELHRGTAKLNADRISGLLSPDESSMTFVRALYHVSGETAETEAPGTTKTSWEGDDLAVNLTPKGNLVRRIDLEGSAAKPASLRSAGNGLTRTLVAPHIEGLLAEKDVLRSANAYGGVDIEEIGPPAAGAKAGSPAPAGAKAGPAGSPGARGGPAKAPGAKGAPPGAPAPAAKAGAASRPGAKGGAPRPAGAPAAGAQAKLAAAGAPAAGAPAAAAAPAAAPSVRRAHGQRADALFRTDGQIASVILVEQVTYGDGDVNATGDRATMDMDAGRGEFFGDPVHVVSPRGEMRAPHVIYTSADQLVHAVEGVHAVIQQAADANLAGSVLGEGKGPVMVQSVEAYWQRPQSSFIFRGDVRAWRGDNLLLAPELLGERLPQGDQLAATGGVKTVWIPGQQEESAPAPGASSHRKGDAEAGKGPPPAGSRPAAVAAGTAASPRIAAGPGGRAAAKGAPKPLAGAAPIAAGPKSAAGAAGPAGAAGTAGATGSPPRAASAGAGATAAGAGTGGAAGASAGAGNASRGTHQGGGGAITVLAANMLYRDGSGILTYTGNVHVDQDGKTLICKQLDVNLDQDHKAKQMTCTGGTHLDDPAAGRKIDGETGVYRLETRKIDIFGDPVVMHDRDGSLVHGKRLRYAIDDGKVEVLGKDDTKPPPPAPAASATGAPPSAAPPAGAPPAAAPPAAAPPAGAPRSRGRAR
jgi:lipopolysaccharide transport protein LptA